jgi:hypothetical protein
LCPMKGRVARCSELLTATHVQHRSHPAARAGAVGKHVTLPELTPLGLRVSAIVQHVRLHQLDDFTRALPGPIGVRTGVKAGWREVLGSIEGEIAIASELPRRLRQPVCMARDPIGKPRGPT